jgi:hypothetical protein
MRGAHRIEELPMKRSTGQVRIAVAEPFALDPIAVGMALNITRDTVLDLRHGGRIAQRDVVEIERTVDEMHVAIDEAGSHEPAVQIDDMGFRPDVALDLPVGSNRD